MNTTFKRTILTFASVLLMAGAAEAKFTADPPHVGPIKFISGPVAPINPGGPAIRP